MDRRTVLAMAAGGMLSASCGGAFAAAPGRLKQGVARTVFRDLPLDECCKIAARFGIRGFDFIGDPKDWPTLKRYGLTMSMYRLDYGGGISAGRSPPGPPGWQAIGLKEAQGVYLAALHEGIDLAAREGFPNVIVTAGTRDHVSYQEGADNAVEFLNQAKAHAEQKGVTLCIENLNSFGIAAPKNSLFDHAPWGWEVCKRVNSPRVKILYDIWHAQLMDGNIVQTIRGNIQWIGHIHTGGVPDRHELFANDELDYRYIAKVIADTGFTGFVTHEWNPSPGLDVADTLGRVVELMTV